MSIIFGDGRENDGEPLELGTPLRTPIYPLIDDRYLPNYDVINRTLSLYILLTLPNFTVFRNRKTK